MCLSAELAIITCNHLVHIENTDQSVQSKMLQWAAPTLDHVHALVLAELHAFEHLGTRVLDHAEHVLYHAETVHELANHPIVALVLQH